MKKIHRTPPAVKVLAFVLTVGLGTGALCGLFYTVRNWDNLFGRGYAESADFYSTRSSYQGLLLEYLTDVADWATTGEDLTYMQEQTLSNLQEQLSAENTNFRFTVRDSQTGNLYFDNTDGQAISDIGDIYGQSLRTFDFTPSSYQDSTDSPWYEETSAPESILIDGVEIPTQLIIESGVILPPVAQDAFYEEYHNYESGNPLWVTLAAASGIAALCLLVFLCCTAGHRVGEEGIHLVWYDRIPYDLYLVILLLLLLGSYAILSQGLEAYIWENSGRRFPLAVAISGAVLSVTLVLGGILSTAVRVKARTIFRNTVIWRLCKLIGRGIRNFAHALPLSWRFALSFLTLMLLNALLALCFISNIFSFPVCFVLVLILDGAALSAGCRWIAQWAAIRSETGKIVGGDPTVQIDTSHMFRDLREHADQLNDLGVAISNAVDERMKSERFKAELITNVSHDLKTPLTSIINYVGLLKKEKIENEKAREYLEVLDRKSQRLKKLTEDLVEASKASTGSLTVNRERLGIEQLVRQAAAEYSDRLAACRLEPILTTPDSELYVWADGRHLWRVLDNLLSNCCKYAMPGSRIYLDIAQQTDTVSVTVKNVSKDPLNVPAEHLLERFVRGDDSRTMEGSGLGLSIAQSLTELQGGAFSLAVDGDLFKASVTLPRAGAISRDAVL